MARRPRANSHDNTIRNIIIGFSVIILIVGALLIWNNRSLSYAGTINGERIPIEHLSFFQNQAWETLVWGGMPASPQTEAWAMELGFDSLLVLHVTAGRAAEFGLSLADVDAEEVESRINTIRMMHDRPDIDMIAAMGFSNASLRRFVELQVLHELVYQHLVETIAVDEEELAEAFEQYLEENFRDFAQVMVHLIVVEEESQADAIMNRILMGADFTELMREYSVIFDHLPRDEDGQHIYAMDFDHTLLAFEPGFTLLAYDLEEGEISDILHMADGGFAIMEVVEINQIRDMDEVEASFREDYLSVLQEDYFLQRLEQWTEEADIVPNSRIIAWEN